MVNLLQICMDDDSKLIALTGDRPTGSLHLGHYVGSLCSRIGLQNTHEQYIMIADLQALTDNIEDRDKIQANILEVLLDYLAVGIDPNRSVIFLQSAVSSLSELAFLFLNFVTVARLERNPTVKDEIRQRGYARDIPAGFFAYPVSQAADILAFNADIVPVGSDQLPMIEQTNEIVRRINSVARTPIFKECRALISEYSRLPGIDGQAKMSKSLRNTINLSATDEEIEQSVQRMFTDPNHLHVNDPGQIKGNVVFDYLFAFDPDKSGLQDLALHYQRGGVGDVYIKKRLKSVLKDFIAPMRIRRENWVGKVDDLRDILEVGNRKAVLRANETLRKFKQELGIGQFIM